MLSHHHRDTVEFAGPRIPTGRVNASDLLRVRRTDHGDGLVVLTVTGEVDLSTLPVLERHLRTDPPPRTIVDLDSVAFCSAAGVGALVRASGDARAARRRFAVVASARPAAHVLSLTHADREIAVFTRLSDAIAHVI